MTKTFRILYVNIVRCVAHLVSSYLLLCLSLHTHHRRTSNCERECVRVCLLQGCIHVKQNQHASTTANTTFLFRFAGSHFASAIIMLHSVPCNVSRLKIEKLLIKFSNIKPKLSTLRFFFRCGNHSIFDIVFFRKVNFYGSKRTKTRNVHLSTAQNPVLCSATARRST